MGLNGGNWNNGVNAGSRTVNLNNYPWNVNTNIGSRAACDSILRFLRLGECYSPNSDF